MAKRTSVFGIYSDRITVSDAIDVLHHKGYRTTDISVLFPQNEGSKDLAHEKETKAPEGAAIGAAAGAVIGAALAWLNATGRLPAVGFRLFVDAGPVMAAFAGLGVGGAIGWLIGLFAGLGKPEYVAKRYAGRTRHGGILLSVHCDSTEWCERAKKTLKNTGARNISSATEAAADYGTTDRPTDRAPATVTDRIEAPASQMAECAVPEVAK